MKGFTFIEIIVVVSIFLILGILTMASFRYFQSRSNLNDDAEAIINILRLAQNKTLASEKETNYGVHFENKSYALFAGPTYVATSTNIVYNLLSKTEIFEISLNGEGKEIIFDRVSGRTNQYGTIKLRLINLPNQQKIISIDFSGQIFLGSLEAYSNPSNRDSRHIHFNYAKNIKTALVLRLYFPDDNFAYDINFQNFLKKDKDEFDWQETVVVKNQNQVLRIHTHSLTDINAQFCIHRDRRYNNKSIQISLDEDNLINYSADGAATKGASLFVTAPEIQ